ncbi:MAG: S-adenosylmethionine:tRNA ribosyltransferase-isomerase [Myxococcota bacterium]|jgi:S-adenosylmethionine:tRNA ribosyltransferase-isomerase
MDPGADPRLLPFDYPLPESLIARYPPTDRDGGRLLDLRDDTLSDRQITDLPELLSPNDLLVVNDARVLAARLQARRKTGGAVEVLLLSDVPDEAGTLPAMLKPSRRLKPGERLTIEHNGVEIEGLFVVLGGRVPGGSWRVQVLPSAPEVMAAAGALPLPPYFDRVAELLDEARYQTIFASRPGAVAAPTAGLHLTEALLGRLAERGVGLAKVTLYVGAGTFRNLRPEDLDSGSLHAERFDVPPETAAAIDATRASGGRVVAVGTTSTRCLESAAVGGGRVAPGGGETRMFIQPGYRFQVIDRLLTNFHLPCSSLLMLVCALGGRERVLAAYDHAVAKGYRFFSYGDAMLIDPQGEAGS